MKIEMDLPRPDCVSCIAQWRFMSCTRCQFVEEMKASAMRYFPHGLSSVGDLCRLYKQELTDEEINKMIDESIGYQSETRSGE